MTARPSVPAALVCICAWVVTATADANLPWLDRVNFYRATAGLPPVEEDPELSGAVSEHARYMVRHLPVIVQLGSGGVTPQVTASWFMDGNRPVRHCVFDETNYHNRNKTEQRGRQ